MKKILLVFLACLSIFFVGCSNVTNKNVSEDPNEKYYSNNFTFEEISEVANEINENSNMKVNFLEVLELENPSHYGKDKPYYLGDAENDCYGYGFHIEKNYMKDVTDELSQKIVITQVDITTSDYDVLGTSVGCDIQSLETSLNEKGFVIFEDNEALISFTKGGVEICYFKSNEKVSEIIIGLNVNYSKLDNMY